MIQQKLTLIFLIGLLSAAQAFGFNDTLETGEILPEGKYRLGAFTQFITDQDSGMNLTAKGSTRIDAASEFSAILGVGTTDFVIGGYYKWVPYPDYESQPAIGLLAGLVYSRYSGLDRDDVDGSQKNEMSLRFQPFVSKTYATDIGPFTPTVSLPLGLRSFNGETTLPIQLALGAEFDPDYFENIRFQAEAGFNLSKSFTYITFGATVTFDEENGIQLK